VEQTEGPSDPTSSLQSLYLRHRKRTFDLFLANANNADVPQDTEATALRYSIKINDEYSAVKDLPPPQTARPAAKPAAEKKTKKKTDSSKEEDVRVVVGSNKVPNRPGITVEDGDFEEDEEVVEDARERILNNLPQSAPKKGASTTSSSLVQYQGTAGALDRFNAPSKSKALALRNPYAEMKPEWHAPWKLKTVISGHLGWVHSLAVDPTNEWFATGSADRTIKIWDLASGQLKLTLTGHISSVRGLVVSDRHPYLFSAGEDKQIKCWDLECNKVSSSGIFVSGTIDCDR